MAQSGYDASGVVVNGLASGYVCRDGQMISAAAVHPSQMHAAGGIHTTAEDLQRWDRSLHGCSLLSPASRDLMFTPHIQVDRAAYGYGWVVEHAFGGRRVWHDGGMPGFLSIVSRYVDDDSVIIALSNFENAAYTELEHGLGAILFGQPYEMPHGRSFVAVDVAVFEPLIGEYESRFAGRPVKLKVFREGDSLGLEAAGLPKTHMRAMSPTRYFAQLKGEVELDFVTDGAQPAREISIRWAGHPMTATRVP
jgi:hypothetical protein